MNGLLFTPFISFCQLLIMVTAVKEGGEGERTDWTEPTQPAGVLSNLGLEGLLKLVQQLPPGCRAVFNLYAIV